MKEKQDAGEDLPLKEPVPEETPGTAGWSDKDFSELYFFVAKMFEFLHLECNYSAEDLYGYLENPRLKRHDRLAKDVKTYIKSQPDIAVPRRFKEGMNVAFHDLSRWAGSYREFVDFIEETSTLKDIVSKMISPGEGE